MYIHSLTTLRRRAARITSLGAVVLLSVLAAACSIETIGMDSDIGRSKEQELAWRRWSQKPVLQGGFQGSPALCDGTFGSGAVDAPGGIDAAGHVTLAHNASTNRYQYLNMSLLRPERAWADLGTRTFSSRPACYTLDGLHTRPRQTWNNQLAIVGRSKNSSTYYIRVMKHDLSCTDSDGDGTCNNQPMTPMKLIQDWVRVSDTSYDGAPGVMVDTLGMLTVIGRKSDKLYLNENYLDLSSSTAPFDPDDWLPVREVPALPSPWVVDGDPTVAPTYSLVGFNMILVKARNTSTDKRRLYYLPYDPIRFLGWSYLSTGNITVASDPAVEVDLVLGAATVYFRGSDNKIYHASGYPFGPWTSFTTIHSDTFTGSPGVLGNVFLEGGHLAAALGSDKQVWWVGGQVF
jgi:hypothetical protein